MKFIVAGFGKFGRLAVSRLSVKYNPGDILAIDPNLESKPLDRPGNVHFLRMDAVRHLSTISQKETDIMVIPTVPFHLAASYILSISNTLEFCHIPDNTISGLPNVYRVDTLNVCCSHADFLCADNCPENEVCTITGETRRPMFEILESLSTEARPVFVIRSHQILPGIGGYGLTELRRLFARLTGLDQFILSTSCKCHAILTGFVNHA